MMEDYQGRFLYFTFLLFSVQLFACVLFSLVFFCIVVCFILVALRTMPGLNVGGGRLVASLVSSGQVAFSTNQKKNSFISQVKALLFRTGFGAIES